MKLKQELCMDCTEKDSRRVFVDLWAHETVLQRRRIVLEVPTDCTDDELEAIGGNSLDDWANAEQVDSWFEAEESEEFEILGDISIEADVPEHLDSDVVLVRDSDDALVLKEEQEDEA